MVEINNQRKAFDMLAWSEGTDNGRQKPEIMLRRHCRRRAIYRLPDQPQNSVTLNPKLKINRRRTLPASSCWWGCLLQEAKPERLLSEKSGRCGIAQD